MTTTSTKATVKTTTTATAKKLNQFSYREFLKTTTTALISFVIVKLKIQQQRFFSQITFYDNVEHGDIKTKLS